MKTFLLQIHFVIILSLFISSCDKDEGPPVNSMDMYNCYQESEWDAVKIKNTLLGKWEWEYISCVFFQDNSRYVHDEELFIEFREDSTLIVTQHSVIIQNSSWHVIDVGNGLFKILEDPHVDQLFGRIIICNERVKFSGVDVDGCDNYFIKSN